MNNGHPTKMAPEIVLRLEGGFCAKQHKMPNANFQPWHKIFKCMCFFIRCKMFEMP